MKRSNKDPRPARGPDGGDAHGLRRRDVLGYATAAPLASAAAGIAGLGALDGARLGEWPRCCP